MIIKQYDEKNGKENKIFQVFLPSTRGPDRLTRISRFGGSSDGHWRKADMNSKFMNNARLLSFSLELIKS